MRLLPFWQSTCVPLNTKIGASIDCRVLQMRSVRHSMTNSSHTVRYAARLKQRTPSCPPLAIMQSERLNTFEICSILLKRTMHKSVSKCSTIGSVRWLCCLASASVPKAFGIFHYLSVWIKQIMLIVLYANYFHRLQTNKNYIAYAHKFGCRTCNWTTCPDSRRSPCSYLRRSDCWQRLGWESGVVGATWFPRSIADIFFQTRPHSGERRERRLSCPHCLFLLSCETACALYLE